MLSTGDKGSAGSTGSAGRAGRTGRAGKSGVCVTFYTRQQQPLLERI